MLNLTDNNIHRLFSFEEAKLPQEPFDLYLSKNPICDSPPDDLCEDSNCKIFQDLNSNNKVFFQCLPDSEVKVDDLKDFIRKPYKDLDRNVCSRWFSTMESIVIQQSNVSRFPDIDFGKKVQVIIYDLAHLLKILDQGWVQDAANRITYCLQESNTPLKPDASIKLTLTGGRLARIENIRNLKLTMLNLTDNNIRNLFSFEEAKLPQGPFDLYLSKNPICDSPPDDLCEDSNYKIFEALSDNENVLFQCIPELSCPR